MGHRPAQSRDQHICVETRLAQGQRAWRVGLAVNATLAAVKLATGILGQSYALIADAVESLGDLFGSAIVKAGLVISYRPADEDHPYGHGKAEPLATLAVAILLIATAGGITWQAIDGIRHPGPGPALYTLPILLAVIGAKELLFRYMHAIGRRIGSTMLAADAWHHRGDALTSVAAAIGITVALIGGERYAAADDIAALAACSIILFNGVRFLRLAIHELMDSAPDDAVAEPLRDIAERIEGAKRVEKILVRKMGPRLFVDLHLEVDETMTVRRAHDIAHQVKDAIMSDRPDVADVLVHVEPYAP